MEGSLIAIPAEIAHRSLRFGIALRSTALAGLLALAACGPSPAPPGVRAESAGWREFQGTWTAAGSRHSIALGSERRAAGFRAEAIVLNDSATGMVGRAVWTDRNGDQAFSELKGQDTNTGNSV